MCIRDRRKTFSSRLKGLGFQLVRKSQGMFVFAKKVPLDAVSYTHLYEAIGIYKVENQESFIEPSQDINGRNLLIFKKGIGSRKLDKACLIILTKKPYTIYIIDNGSKDTEYWKNDCLLYTSTRLTM